MKVHSTVALALALASMASVALAHHSFAMFDQSQRVTLKGTVKEFQWTNPHAFIELEVLSANGKAEVWSIELNSPNNLRGQGWKSSSVKPGDVISLITAPLRDLSEHKGGLFISLTRADGTVLREAAFAGATGPVNVLGPPPAK